MASQPEKGEIRAVGGRELAHWRIRIPRKIVHLVNWTELEFYVSLTLARTVLSYPTTWTDFSLIFWVELSLVEPS